MLTYTTASPARLRDIAAKELRLLRRDGRLRLMLIAMALLLLAALLSGVSASRRWQAEADVASAQDRVSWLAQGDRNPHSVAHFGQYAFKPAGAQAFFDPGLSPTLGSGLWMEAHTQNTANLRPAEQGGDRRGGLPAAWLLQLGLPLLILLAGHGLWAAERESGTLRLQAVQGACWTRLLAGKTLVLAALALAVWLPLAVLLLVLSDAPGRAVLAAGAYLGYALIWVGLSLAVSALAMRAGTALVALLALWLATVLLVPRLAADAAERLHPSPSAAVFWAGIGKAQAEGMDGHDSKDERARKLLQDTLDRFGAKSEAELPISFAGIALQASEEDGNRIFDRFYGQLGQTHAAQDRVRLAWSVLSPLPALQALSQAAAGTDLAHHLHFSAAAEAHRRALQRFLNADFTANAKGRDFDYRADSALWQHAPAWHYARPQLADSGSAVAVSAAVLLAWLLVAASAAAWATHRLSREDLP